MSCSTAKGDCCAPMRRGRGVGGCPVTVKDVDPRFLRLLFVYEDKRFYEHHGVDPLSMVRAAYQFVTSGHIVSGGSTITMQLARLLEPREHRTLGAKLRQIVRALEIEHALGKDDILALYLTLAPYGGNLEGVRAASLAYFGKEPRKLSLAEAALLVALPQSPELRRPDRSPETARAARDRVLDRIAAAGVAPRDEIARAKTQSVPHERKQLPMLAPHAADQVVSASSPIKRVHRLTIDLPLQKSLQDLALRTRAGARSGYFRRHSCGRQCKRRGEGARRLGGLFRYAPRRPGRHDAGAAVAGLDAQAVHLRTRVRRRSHPSRDADRRQALPLRQLRAGKFRSDVPGHRHHPPRAAIVAQRSGDCRARQGRRQPSERAAHPNRRRARPAEERGARSRDGTGRRRRQANGSGDALCGAGPAGLGDSVERA